MLGLLIINTVLLICLVIIACKLCKYVIYLSDINYTNSLLTDYEKEELHKQRKFDTRIQRLKEELAIINTAKQTERHGKPAQEFHPLVKNLPHDSVRITEQRLPDVEYAE